MKQSLCRRVMRGVVWGGVMVVGVSGALGQAAAGEGQKVTVTLSADEKAGAVSPTFMGVSYESREILPKGGKYYFDAGDENLVRVFRTLGIKSLRVGANAVDDPKVAVPDERAIDAVFTFARKVGAKVIYSFRLKNGDPAEAARLAAYIAKKYPDCLDCFCIGNEPNFYLKTYEAFEAAWKPEYEAILKAVPDARFDGPATSSKSYSLQFADEFAGQGHLAMVSTHTYPLGNGRNAEKDPAAARGKFLEKDVERHYRATYDGIVKPLAEKGVAYRMDETNSCYRGGAEGCSDAYASALWGLDYLNWWAGHHILGLNFHTGDTVNGIPPMKANYACFVHEGNGKDFEVRPLSYAMLAFTQVAHGKAMDVAVDGAAGVDFTAYGYEEGEARYVALLNKSYGEGGKAVTVSVRVAGGVEAGAGRWASMVLAQKGGDVAAKGGVELGGSGIDPEGRWEGKWGAVEGGADGNVVVTVKPAEAVLLRCSAGR